jgi:hypothetical protein
MADPNGTSDTRAIARPSEAVSLQATEAEKPATLTPTAEPRRMKSFLVATFCSLKVLTFPKLDHSLDAAIKRFATIAPVERGAHPSKGLFSFYSPKLVEEVFLAFAIPQERDTLSRRSEIQIDTQI